VRDYLEMKIRTLLTRRKRRRKTSIGWWRWSNAYVGKLGCDRKSVQPMAITASLPPTSLSA
jgi:hypothetical protein